MIRYRRAMARDRRRRTRSVSPRPGQRIVRCDRIANGIIAAVKELDLSVPVIVRLAGTNAEEAKALLADAGVALISADSFEDAARKAVDAAEQAKN